jgi:hypothetical protein
MVNIGKVNISKGNADPYYLLRLYLISNFYLNQKFGII